MFKLIKIIFIVAILALTWWLLSPLFVEKKVDNQLEPKVESALNFVLEKAGEGLQKAGEKLQDTNVSDLKKKIAELKASMDNGSNLNEQIIDEETMNKFIEEMTKTEDKSVDEKELESEALKVLASGKLKTVAYEGTGDVRVIHLKESEVVVRLENLNILNGPDLHVVLSKLNDVEKTGHLGDYVELRELKGNKGNQNYLVPGGVNIVGYHSVVIFSKTFGVVFNSANLESSN